MASLSVTECSDTVDGQKWNVMADGRIALQLSSPRKYLVSKKQIGRPFGVAKQNREES